MIDEIKRDRYAYEWVGSAPCEDCDKFRECEEADSFSCKERKAWNEKYEERKRELMLSFEQGPDIEKIFSKTLGAETEPVKPSGEPVNFLQFKQEKHDEGHYAKVMEEIKKQEKNREKVKDATDEERQKAMRIMKMEPEKFSKMNVYWTACGKLAVRTPLSWWMSLCGREWHVDMDNETYECVSLS